MNIGSVAKYMETRPVGALGGRRYFSVMILLVERADGIHVLFEQRSRKMKTQPGDVCFPGGRMEEGETPLECALRETFEEIGIDRQQIRVLGQFDSLYEISSITMHTFLGVIQEEALGHLKLNSAEVEQVFLVPWDFFLKSEPKIFESQFVQKVDEFPYEEIGVPKDYRWRTGKNPIPIYQYDLRPGDVVAEACPGETETRRQTIWGLTGRIIWKLTDELGRLPDFEG